MDKDDPVEGPLRTLVWEDLSSGRVLMEGAHAHDLATLLDLPIEKTGENQNPP